MQHPDTSAQSALPAGNPAYYAPTPRRAAWPRVIGILSIVWGGLTLLFGAVGLAWWSYVLFSARLAVSPGDPRTIVSYLHWALGSSIAGVGLSILLIVAGILLLKRRPAARSLHLAYGLLKILQALGNTGMTVLQIRWLAVSASGPASLAPSILPSAISGGVSLAIAMLYPVFCLAWFLREGVVAEVRTWRRP